ncbi:MAG: hypothetical protein ABIW30_06680 [Arenimonas sp.]
MRRLSGIQGGSVLSLPEGLRGGFVIRQFYTGHPSRPSSPRLSIDIPYPDD